MLSLTTKLTCAIDSRWSDSGIVTSRSEYLVEDLLLLLAEIDLHIRAPAERNPLRTGDDKRILTLKPNLHGHVHEVEDQDENRVAVHRFCVAVPSLSALNFNVNHLVANVPFNQSDEVRLLHRAGLSGCELNSTMSGKRMVRFASFDGIVNSL